MMDATPMPQQTCISTDTDGKTVLLRCNVLPDGSKQFFLGNEALTSYVDDGVVVAINRNGRKYVVQQP